MATTHKTYAGMIRAAEQLIGQLESGTALDKRDYNDEYRAVEAKVNALMGELRGLWTNPAHTDETAAIRIRLADAWHDATD